MRLYKLTDAVVGVALSSNQSQKSSIDPVLGKYRKIENTGKKYGYRKIEEFQEMQ